VSVTRIPRASLGFDECDEIPVAVYGEEERTNGADQSPPGVEIVDSPIELLALDYEQIMKPIPPERDMIPGMVPREAYTLIAGALSSYKSTLLIYLVVWRATGFDLLDMDPGGSGIDIGPATLIVYEDTAKRVTHKYYRVLQQGYAEIERIHGTRHAEDFLHRAVKNVRLICLTGTFRKTLVIRVAGEVMPNEAMISELTTKVGAFASSDLLLGLDPMRLAIVGSQNDDDGADVAVQTFNRVSVIWPDSALVLTSHTTKSGAQESADGYSGKAYSTSGSALYSQHARSNFHIARLKPEEIAAKFDKTIVSVEDAARQPVARLSHGRLSHGPESTDIYLRMYSGVLTRLKPREPRTSSENVVAHIPEVVAAIDRIKTKANVRASESTIVMDEMLLSNSGLTAVKMRALLKVLDENGYIEFTGKTKNRDCMVTSKGRAAVGTNQNESGKQPW
jgi:AAA domain